MSDRHAAPQVPCESIREDLPAWSLRALNTTERAVVDRHLDRCPGCRAEADRWTATSTALPLSLNPTWSPPPDLRDRLMARVAAEPRPARPVPARRPAPARAGTFSWSQIIAAPLLIALIVVSAWAFQLQDRVASLEDNDGAVRTAAIDESLLPQGVQTYSLRTECPNCPSSGRVLADPAKAEALVMAWGLDPEMVHQVWCVDRDGERTMVASLNVGPTGDVVQPLAFQEPIAGYSEIYVMSRNGSAEQKMAMDETPIAIPPDPDTPSG